MTGLAPTVVARHALTWVVGTGESKVDRQTLTIQELAALQTFPPDYTFPSKKFDAYVLIGNAIPPRVAELILGKVAV